MRIAVLGVGNVLFRDEGLGVFVVKYLEKNYKLYGDVDLLDGGTGGLKLLEYFKEYDIIIMVDVVSIDDKVGSVHRIEGESVKRLLTNHRTAHEVGIGEVMEMISLLDRSPKVVIIGVVPEDVYTPRIGLSPSLERVFPNIVEAILKELESLGVSFEKVQDIPLSEIGKL
ncbi:MAG: HyaD/HybD family hydrogenase maturation endopeptidase [Hydrogenothermaceae bacterium]|nr:HyaD/HybD family hydrogenase maturation endopeptidase [Hydrogenothermaceae bacterium]